MAGGRYQFNVTRRDRRAERDQKQPRTSRRWPSSSRAATKPVKVVYHDGGSHESFVTALAGVIGSDGSLVVDTRMRDKFGDVSRPEGLSSGPQEIALDDSGQAEARSCRRRPSPSRP